ncbi:MAG: hypothetical protein IPO17_03290 [Flavobacteriales bacterium]|nr:hypothetical protein [Flavobacteriales bacterium]
MQGSGLGSVALYTKYITSKYQNALQRPAAFDPELNSNIGEFVGGVVGTLFSLVGVLLYFAAIRMQSRELRLMRDALALQNESVQLQVNELKVLTREISRGEMTRNYSQCFRELKDAQNRVENFAVGGALGIDGWKAIVSKTPITCYFFFGTKGALWGINCIGYFPERRRGTLHRIQTALERLSRFAQAQEFQFGCCDLRIGPLCWLSFPGNPR